MSFRNYLEEEFLTEAVKNAAEYYITDDSKMPDNIHAAYEVNGTKYLTGLIKTKYNGVYKLDNYRLINKNKSLWSFKSPSDIPIVLATVIRFVEGTMAWMHNHVDGIIIEIPTKLNSTKYNKLVNLLVRKSLYTKYKSLPVIQNEKKGDTAKGYLFIIKKGVQPKQLFKSAKFKGYDFPKDIIDADVLTGIDPNKPIKKQANLNPSKKYTLNGNIDGIDADEVNFDNIDKILDIKPVDMLKVTDGTEDAAKKKFEEDKAEELKALDTEISTLTKGVEDRRNNIMQKGDAPILSFVMARMESMRKKLEDYGYDESKLNYGDMKYAFSNNITDKISQDKVMRSWLESEGLTDESNILTEKGFDRLKFMMQAYAKDPKKYKNDIESQDTDFANYAHYKDMLVGTASKKANIEEKKYQGNHNHNSGTLIRHEKADIELELKADNNEMFPEPEFVNESYNVGWRQNNNEYKTVEHVIGMGYTKDDIVKDVGPIAHEKIRDYTGSSSGVLNFSLRRAWEVHTGNKSLADYNAEYSTPEYHDLVNGCIKAFDNIRPIKESIWVSRKTDWPDVSGLKIGQDMIDPGALSTSIDFSIWSGSTGLAIFVPKGSRVIPVLGVENSKNSSEREVILPPMSIIRPIEIMQVESGAAYIKAVYVGSAYKSYIDMMKKNGIISDSVNGLTETKETNLSKTSKEQNTKDKLSSFSLKDMKKLDKLIKSGKLKKDTFKK